MKKYFLFFTIVFFNLTCIQNKKTIAEPPATDSLNKVTHDSVKEMMKVSELSVDEMKDDSVFLDGSIPVPWEDAGITNVKELKSFIKQLQQWVIENNKEKLAEVIKYPLKKKYKTPADVIAHYDEIFTREVKMSLATINFSQLFRTSQGVMTDGGKIWIAQQENEFKIIAINL